MTVLPRLQGREVVRALQRAGFQAIRRRGSHIIRQPPDGRMTVVPAHRGEELGPGLTGKILKDIRLTPEEFRDLLRG